MVVIPLSNDLVLRPPTDSDAPNYVELIADSDLHEFIPVLRSDYSEEHAQGWIDHCRKIEATSGHPSTFVICEASGHFIGQIGLDDFERAGQETAEIGYWLGRPYRERGIMSAALPAFLEYAFRTLRVGKICARTLASNRASQRLLHRCQFTRTSDSDDNSILFYELDVRASGGGESDAIR